MGLAKETILVGLSALICGAGFGMILSSGPPPSFMPVMPQWLYLLVGILAFASGFTVILVRGKG